MPISVLPSPDRSSTFSFHNQREQQVWPFQPHMARLSGDIGVSRQGNMQFREGERSSDS
jgi:hypothetical protein